MKKISICLMFWLMCGGDRALETAKRLPQIHGTLRGKYELQTEGMEQQFEVRTARQSVTGGVTLSLNKHFISDIRINYEKYFYPRAPSPSPRKRTSSWWK